MTLKFNNLSNKPDLEKLLNNKPSICLKFTNIENNLAFVDFFKTQFPTKLTNKPKNLKTIYKNNRENVQGVCGKDNNRYGEEYFQLKK